MEKNNKSRNWIKGHFYQGVFYGGIVFGLSSGLLIYLWGTKLVLFSLIPVLILHFKIDKLEEFSYR